VNERPVTGYATASDGASLAYHVTGEGPLDLVWNHGLGFPIDLLWDDPSFRHVVKRLRGFSRTVWWEPRGSGASGGSFIEFEETAVADITAVVDAVGFERVTLVASGIAGPVAIRETAAHPERVSALVLIDAHAHYVREVDYRMGFPPDVLERTLSIARERWGTGASIELTAPSMSADDQFRERIARCERLGSSPERVVEVVRSGLVQDVRHLLAGLCVPTLVVHRAGDRFIRAEAGHYLAEHIPGAKYVELPGEDHMFFVGDSDALLDEVEEFLTGTHQAPEGDVVMAAVLFTDVVSSTEQSARVGHRKWTALIDAHNTMVRASLARYRGREIKTIGDGFLATFDATTRAVRAAVEIVTQAKHAGVDVRAGVHSGEVETRPDDVVGLAVTIAKRVCDLAHPGAVLVSETVKEQLVGTGITTSPHGTHTLKGVPDQWHLFTVTTQSRSPP
jgi:class 3 adenylate cyclase/pimeloyl-ACP methyl ester carboxylesterase